MESWRAKIKPSGRSKANEPCKKHPKHIQSPGVCSICLNEKLSQLNIHTKSSSRATKARRNKSYSSSSSYLSSLSSSNASSYSSPIANHRKSNTCIFKNNFSGQEILKKSRSMAFVWHKRKQEDENVGKNVEMKRGFWSKLLPRRNNKNKGLMHSRTTRKRVITTVD